MDPPKSKANTITRYLITEEHLVGEATEPVQHYDLLSVIMICLGGPDADNYDGIIRMLDVLLSSETSESEKRRILQDDYDIQMTKAMEKEVSDMCNLSAGVEARGIAKGRMEGERKGMTNAYLASVHSLMRTAHVSARDAMTMLEIPETEWPKYLALLEQKA